MNIETANDVLTSQQIDIAIACGRRYGSDEADLWFDQHEDATALPDWTMGTWEGNATEICGVELTEEQEDAFDYVVDINARDSWNEFQRV